jgi:pyridoxine 5-phosphate synthase
MKTQLSVNINKIALLRNSRGGNTPDVIKMAMDAVRFGADGITIHPRPDERHIRYADAVELKKVLNVELNIEGNPQEKKFIDLVLKVKPAQVTLVPDAQNQLTSNQGWNTIKHKEFLKEIVSIFKSEGIRTSIFIDPLEELIKAVPYIGSDRIELYTEQFAKEFPFNPTSSVKPYIKAASLAEECGLQINAGHDLNLQNLSFFAQNVKPLHEVSIGHALISDSLYLGFENTIQLYQRCLKN